MIAIESSDVSGYEKPSKIALAFTRSIEADEYAGNSAYISGVRSVLYESENSEVNEDDSETFNFGASLGKSLIDLGWNKDRKTEENTKLIYSQKGYDGQIYYKSQSLIIISGILHGKDYLEVVDEISQNKSPGITAEEYKKISTELGVKDTSQIEVADTNDDIIPYLDRRKVSNEVFVPFYEALMEANEGIATYGGIAADVLYNSARENNVPISERAEICADDDQSLGIRMPESWYFNPSNITIGLFFNWVQARDYLGNTSNNAEFRKLFGTVGFLETYDVDQLAIFAEKNGYQVFSTKFSLQQMGKFISANIEGLLSNQNMGNVEEYAQEIVRFLATSKYDLTPTQYLTRLTHLPDDRRKTVVLNDIRDYWSKILVAKGISTGDKEIAMFNPFHSPTNSLDKTRQPMAVFVGGNIDKFNSPLAEDVIIRNNLRLATDHYPPNTKLISPIYTTKSGRNFRPSMISPRQKGATTDSIVISLLSIREKGKTQDYIDLRTKYNEMSS